MGNIIAQVFPSEEETLEIDDGADDRAVDFSSLTKAKGCLRKTSRKQIEGQWKVVRATNYRENEDGHPINSEGRVVEISARDGHKDACKWEAVEGTQNGGGIAFSKKDGPKYTTRGLDLPGGGFDVSGYTTENLDNPGGGGVGDVWEVAADMKIYKESKYSRCTEAGLIDEVWDFRGGA